MTEPTIYRGSSPYTRAPAPDPPFPPDQIGTAQTQARSQLGPDWFNVARFIGPWAGDGQTDVASNFNTALGAAGSGTVFVPAGIYYLGSTVTVPEATSLVMDPQAVLMYHGTGACLSHHGSNDSFTPTFARPGRICGGIIDGTSAAAGAAGLDAGDGRYHDVSGLLIRHFNGAASIGAYLVNRNTFTEDSDFQIHLADCTQHIVLDAAGGLTSHMYSNYDFTIFANTSQDGLVVQGGSQPSRCRFRLRGNFQSGAVNTGAVIRITGAGSSIAQSFWDLGVESDGNGAVGHQTFVTAAAGNTFTTQTGILAYLNPAGATAFSPASLADNWNFTGPIAGDATLSNPATPAVPASGTTLTNHSNGAMVYITGGAVTGISIDGNPTGLTSGSFHVDANSGTIKLTYTAAPAWVWVWDTQ